MLVANEARQESSSSLIAPSISVLPALVTSKACSHAAQCLPWIIETTLCPAQSSPLNSPPRHSDTLQPRRDSFTLTQRNMGLLRAPEGRKASQRAPITAQTRETPTYCTPQTRPFDPDRDQWNQIHPLGSAFIGAKCCHSFCSVLLGVIHGTEGMLSFFFYLVCLTHLPSEMN